MRIATFNCENLFARFKFKEGVDPAAASLHGWDVNEQAFQGFTSEERNSPVRRSEKPKPTSSPFKK